MSPYLSIGSTMGTSWGGDWWGGDICPPSALWSRGVQTRTTFLCSRSFQDLFKPLLSTVLNFATIGQANASYCWMYSVLKCNYRI